MNWRYLVLVVCALTGVSFFSNANAAPQPSVSAYWWEMPPQGRTVMVLDYTSPEWRDAIDDAVARWNEQLEPIEGARLPRLVVEQRDEGFQSASPEQVAHEEAAIVIISPDVNVSWNGLTRPFPMVPSLA